MRGIQTVLLCALLAAGCKTSNRGEACQSSSQCGGDLACVAVAGGGVCRAVNLGISPSAKQCALVQCAAPADCCTLPNAPPTCTAAMFNCTNDRCVATMACTTDAQCFGQHCLNGSCVRCVQDSDCNMSQTCSNNTCVPKCTTDSQCPIFSVCTNGACTVKGCESDRECILFESSEFAFCDTKAMPPTCSARCDNDAECDTGNRPAQLCQNHQCVDTGCADDEECKALLGSPPQGEHVVCR
jgi:hypothetical protein